MSRFFIDRPIFAWVLAALVMLGGLLSIFSMSVSQYPNIAPPTITVSAFYPGASAKTAEDSVTQIIEQQMKGLDGLYYMSSTSASNGSVSVSLNFKAGTNPDIAQVQVQNKLQAGINLLPQSVQQQGVTVSKSGRTFMVVLGFVSSDGSMDGAAISDYVVSHVIDPLSRVQGVGDLQVFGTQYAMRVWLNPAKLNSYQLTTSDVINAIQAQNAQVSAGQLGGTPAVAGQALNATVTAQSLLKSPEEFRQIFLKTTSNGAQVRLGDVARVELGGENFDTIARYNRQPAVGVAVKLAAGQNALKTAAAVEAKMAELKPNFPAGLNVIVPYDTTPVVKISIKNVIETLVEAIVLVFLVMYLFLQNFRATLIPTIAVPVVLLGTFGILNFFGFSINTLTLFGLVLAIGLLVDDAIVVVENVERVMHEDKLGPVEATRKSMDQITGALIGIGVVLSAVFVPMIFFGGSTGVIYRQFAVTLISAMGLSVITALILTPALCATLLKAPDPDHHEKKGFFGWFNRVFDRSSARYQTLVGIMLAKSARYIIVYAAVIALMAFLFFRLPSAFLPDEDQGILFSQIQLPAGATQERTLKTIKKVEDHFLNNEKNDIEGVFSVAGFSFSGTGQNMGIAFVRLKDWEKRPSPSQSVGAMAGRAMGAFSQLKDAMVFAFPPPAVIELGVANGFDMYLQDRSGVGHEKLMEARNQLLGMAAMDPKYNKTVVGVRPNGQEDSPQYNLDINQAQAGATGVSIADINSTISTAWGSTYVNQFLDKGRIKKVYVQGEADSRMSPEDVGKWYVRGSSGAMVPLTAFTQGRWSYGAPQLQRYNGFPAFEIQGNSMPGKSSGDALKTMEEIVSKLPPGIGFEWTGMSQEEKTSGAQAPALYALSMLIVFLCLAALYESWSVPFAIMLVVPLGVMGALLATWTRGLSDDIYLQVGLLTVIGISTKNAILIVEFAVALQEQGEDLIHSILHAVRIRLRPIIMTSFAFILGVLPLAISNGAGSGSQHAIGTGVIGGMLSATILGVFLIPVFYLWIRSIFKGKSTPNATATATPTSATPSTGHSLDTEK
ncbi:efflux RND transporter permease subunit [Aquirhabdus sp.]|uniref:efflux RND transporter permease subunit n=1 Tax=Aquirhabdus sp. TaxID=2824160 RepID=UPI00396CFF0D